MNSDPKVCSEGKIWDLHIHSNQCKSYVGKQIDASIEDYIDELVELFSDFPNVEMISFTDHNHMSWELYNEGISRDRFPNLLPGVEVDVRLSDDGVSKHLVVYFDAVNDTEKIRWLSGQLNDYFRENEVSAKHPVAIDGFLNRLLELQVPFTLSPHAMKQGRRAFDYDMHSMDPSERDVYKYVDQFFSLWETSGKSSIAYAIEFLQAMDCNDKVSVVAFSDSHSIEDLREYLKKPSQYFYALPNYMGLRLVGTEVSRILESRQTLSPDDRGKYIGSIVIGETEITLSPRLNAIIGGRGSGKSVLLDSLALNLGQAKCVDLLDKRVEFLNKHKVEARNFAGSTIAEGSFAFDYYNQSYISRIFNSEGEEYSARLMLYFERAFADVEEIDRMTIEAANRTAFAALLEESTPVMFDNISGLIEKYAIDHNDTLNLQVKKSMKPKISQSLATFNYEKCLEKINEAVVKHLPKFLRDNRDIELAISDLDRTIVEQAGLERIRYISESKPIADLIDAFFAKKDEISKAQANKSNVEKAFENAFASKAAGMKSRVALVRAYLIAEKDFMAHYEKDARKPGKECDAFRFVKTLDIVSPIEHFMSQCDKCFTVEKVPTDNRNLKHLEKYIEEFCFSEEGYKAGHTWKALLEELKRFDLTYTPGTHIEYKTDGSYMDISKLSPGTQANILLEYIVHSDSSIPLLIDQPEDNVDNQTIFRDIRDWFSKIKTQRQVIVVTHDANIVVNADAENVIIANQSKPSIFTYRNGALEYSDNIDEAAKILDGGKTAVKRRLMKYGE